MKYTTTKDIASRFMDVLTPRCPECNTQLDSYPYYDEDGAFRICPKCNQTIREK